ncbi:hypothetical protein PR048_028767 [Dryococelus australis]|uniref:Uncharacterized protein n=1 Tax=Dryococelus australis TaxID=614101 RepID=A0ABQ9GF65_9NEOP|nr:hypothetical protein PR048_028767 [Dryococelus australis]
MKNIQSQKQERGEYTVFEEQVAIKLRKILSPHARDMVQHVKNNTLFQAEMGKYKNPPAVHYPVFLPFTRTFVNPPTCTPSTSVFSECSNLSSTTTNVRATSPLATSGEETTTCEASELIDCDSIGNI